MTISLDLRRQALRAAVKIHERLRTPARSDSLERLPRHAWDRLRSSLWRLRKVEVRGWQAAAREVADDVDFDLRQLIEGLESLRDGLPRTPAARQIIPPSQIMADLVALEAEFDEVEIDLKEKSVSATTEPITLDGVYLGPFEIRLKWERIGVRTTPYDVIAVAPHHPTDNEDVTHPHVSGNKLCEGDAAVPIRQALASGRLLDFFLIVRQTLETYNPSSPYVSLKHWNGTSCADCGYGMSQDEGATCERCHESVCDECYCTCESCSSYLCHECSAECAECNHRFCLACLGTPANAAQLLCPSCNTKGQTSDDEDQSPGPAPAVHPVRLGQAAAAA